MYRFEAAPLSRRIRFTTRLFFTIFLTIPLLMLIVAIVLYFTLPALGGLIQVLSGFGCLMALVFLGLIWLLSRQTPQYYQLDESRLRVVRRKPWRDLIWDLSDVIQIEEKQDFPLYRRISYRKSANQGIFCVSGKYWRKDLDGWLQVALSSDERFILMGREKGAYAISPAQPEEFLRSAEYLRSR